MPRTFDQFHRPQRSRRVGEEFAVQLLAPEAGAGVEALDIVEKRIGQMRIGAVGPPVTTQPGAAMMRRRTGPGRGVVVTTLAIVEWREESVARQFC